MNNAVWLQFVATIVTGVGSASGLWAFMQRRDQTKKMNDRLLLGLAYGRLVDQGMQYIMRGWITHDEYEDYRRLLYDPYVALGGNGVTGRIMAEVTSLPIRPRAKYSEILEEAKTRSSRDYSTDAVLDEAA